MTAGRSRLSLFASLALAVAGLTGAAYAHHVAVTATVSQSVAITETGTTNFPGVSLSVAPAIKFSQTFTSGTGTNALDKKWCDRRTIAASGADTLDLAGVLTNEYGATVTFGHVRVMAFKADSANTNDVWVGGAAANRFNSFLKDSSVIVLHPGYMNTLSGHLGGYPVSAGSADKALVKNSGGTTGVTYEVCFGGTST
jgi:hypothetical protein